jgi:hypothetical protein
MLLTAKPPGGVAKGDPGGLDTTAAPTIADMNSRLLIAAP